MSSPRAFLPLTLALLGALGGCTPQSRQGEEGAPHLLLLTLDTTRLDALSCAADPDAGASTPHLDRLAAEGILFEAAYTAVPLTLPAHASILSGLYPPRHGVRDNGMGALPEAAETLAERVGAAGYDTAACVASVVLDASFGLAQGFDHYAGPQGGVKGAHNAERPAADVVDAALAWLAARDDTRPFLLWLHFYDPHTPYEPPPELARGTPRGNYLGEVSAMDREIGRLLQALRADGLLEHTVVLAVGDHGEAFGEHDENGHSVHCYDTTLAVPLILRLPDGTRAGERSDEVVSIVDVLPTLLDALGLEPPAGIDGRSLLAAPAAQRGVYFESYYGFLSFGWSPVAGWLDARGKYVHSADPELFDLADDPAETTNLVRERADDVRRYRVAIAELAERDALAAEGVAEDLLADIRGLGYAGLSSAGSAMPHPLADSGLPSPASMNALYDESLRAIELAEAGRVEEAAEILTRVLERNAKNAFVLEQLANCQVHLGRTGEAAATLQRLIDVAAASKPGIWFKLGRCLRAEGRLPEAIDALERAAELAPRRPYLRELADTLREAGRDGEAAEVEGRMAEPRSRG